MLDPLRSTIQAPFQRIGSLLATSLLILLALPAMALAAPFNDNFATPAWAGLSSTFTGSGSNVGATAQIGEPRHAGQAAQRSAWWRWRAPGDGTVTIQTCNSTFDTRLGVYTGTAVDALTTVAQNDDYPGCTGGGGGGLGSRVTFSARSGVYYRLAVDGFNGASGNISLVILQDSPSAPQNDSFSASEALSGSSTRTFGGNLRATAETGEANHLTGTGSASRSVWYRWTAPAGGRVTVDTCGSDFDSVLGVYTGTAVDALAVVERGDDSGTACTASGGDNADSRVQFDTRAGVTYRIAVDGFAGASGAVTLGVNLVPDTTPPDTSITSGPAGSLESRDATFEFTATEAGSTFECSVEGGTYAACTSPKVLSALALGNRSFAVRATDPAGNTDPSPAERSWMIVDTTAPDTTIDSGPSGSEQSRTATLGFSASEPGSTFECALDGAAYAPCSSPNALTGLSPGNRSFAVRAVDPSGNRDFSPATRSWTIVDPPTSQPQTQPAPVVRKPGKCAKLKGKKRAACIKKACGKKKGAKKKKACVKAVTRK